MTEINFYQLDDVLVKSMAPLLLKALDEKKKTLVFCPNQTKLKEIDDGLWQFGKNKFIPHATLEDKNLSEFGLKRQPIFLSLEEKNINEADYLVLTDNASESFLSSFSRVFYFYEEREFEKVKKFAEKFKKIKIYKKIDGKWTLSKF